MLTTINHKLINLIMETEELRPNKDSGSKIGRKNAQNSDLEISTQATPSPQKAQERKLWQYPQLRK